jgi:hypothetical protein
MALATALALGWAGAAGANDSTAELATGGLVLTKTTAIEMKSEDLFISPKQVRVKYQFLNTTSQDVTVTVAFPMPDITTEGMDDNIAVPTQNATNILGFSVMVDGKPVAAQVEQKVVKDGVDRTAYLKSIGAPLNPYLQSTGEALDKLPKAARDNLVKLGLAIVAQYGDSDTTMQDHWQPTWTLKTTYYWKQTFPAGKILNVEHQYTPSVGSSAGTQWGSKEFPSDAGYAAQKAKYCVDDDFLASVKKHIPAGQDYSPMFEQRIDYILKSGANWKSPIGDFRMTIDKGDPATLVSFCGTGVKKIGPTQFQVHYTNFTPTQDVAILLLAMPSSS